MYLSKLELDIMHPSVRRGLADANDMHRNIMRAFPDDLPHNAREKAAVLYRIMTERDRPVLYVTADAFPDWSLCQGLRQCAVPKQIDALRDVFKTGARMRFSVLASPTKKTDKGGKNSSRVFLKEKAERAAWLMRKAEQNGFRLLTLEERQHRQIRGNKSGQAIRYTGVLFEGVLEIVDADAFWHAYVNGIGPGKAYGLGMLMVSRV